MATVPGIAENLGQGLMRVTWAAMAGGDDGEPVRLSSFPDKTAQATGDGTSVAINGSNDGTAGGPLNDADGTVIDLDPTADEVVMIRENPLYVWPVVTGGSSTTVIIIAHTER